LLLECEKQAIAFRWRLPVRPSPVLAFRLDPLLRKEAYGGDDPKSNIRLRDTQLSETEGAGAALSTH
jgi:hypothetical protein